MHLQNGKNAVDDIIKDKTHLILGQAVQASQENTTRMLVDANNILEAKVVNAVETMKRDVARVGNVDKQVSELNL